MPSDRETARTSDKRTNTVETTTEEKDAAAAQDLKERQEKLSDNVDDVLDEIDDVLESNAEDFVRSFVQKGGQ